MARHNTYPCYACREVREFITHDGELRCKECGLIQYPPEGTTPEERELCADIIGDTGVAWEIALSQAREIIADSNARAELVVPVARMDHAVVEETANGCILVRDGLHFWLSHSEMETIGLALMTIAKYRQIVAAESAQTALAA